LMLTGSGSIFRFTSGHLYITITSWFLGRARALHESGLFTFNNHWNCSGKAA